MTHTCTNGAWAASGSCGAGAGSGSAPAVGIDPEDNTQFILNNGQTMPVVSFGFEIYNDRTATQLMGTALDKGVRNFFASVLANNQPGVGAKLRTMEAEHGVTREEIFLCGSVTQCRPSMNDEQCYQYTADMAQRNLDDLGVDYLDQIMLDCTPPPFPSLARPASPATRRTVRQTVSHRIVRRSVRTLMDDQLTLSGVGCADPPSARCNEQVCTLIKAQWRAFEDMLERGETLGIAVSNYCTPARSAAASVHRRPCAHRSVRSPPLTLCSQQRAPLFVRPGPCHLDCILDDPGRVTPVVNQLKYHVGMGADPGDFIADNYERGVVPQAYSPLNRAQHTRNFPACASFDIAAHSSLPGLAKGDWLDW